jgi:hypothetical protein
VNPNWLAGEAAGLKVNVVADEPALLGESGEMYCCPADDPYTAPQGVDAPSTADVKGPPTVRWEMKAPAKMVDGVATVPVVPAFVKDAYSAAAAQGGVGVVQSASDVAVGVVVVVPAGHSNRGAGASGAGAPGHT